MTRQPKKMNRKANLGIWLLFSSADVCPTSGPVTRDFVVRNDGQLGVVPTCTWNLGQGHLGCIPGGGSDCPMALAGVRSPSCSQLQRFPGLVLQIFLWILEIPPETPPSFQQISSLFIRARVSFCCLQSRTQICIYNNSTLGIIPKEICRNSGIDFSAHRLITRHHKIFRNYPNGQQ